MGGGHSQNVRLDSAITLCYAPYFENAPTLGLYPTTLNGFLGPNLCPSQLKTFNPEKCLHFRKKMGNPLYKDSFVHIF
jgi:hypothetical protein